MRRRNEAVKGRREKEVQRSAKGKEEKNNVTFSKNLANSCTDSDLLGFLLDTAMSLMVSCKNLAICIFTFSCFFFLVSWR